MARTTDPELDEYTLVLWDTVIRIIHSFRAGSLPLEETELTFPQTLLLIELQKGGRLSMGELSQRLHVTQGVATRMVDLLLEKGLVERNRDRSDRRVVMVEPTAQGADIARQVVKSNRARMGEVLASVPMQERRFLLEFLKGLQQQFEGEGAVQAVKATGTR